MKRLKKNIATYYYKLLFSREYGKTYWPRVKYALKYLSMAEPSGERRKEVIRDFIIPPFAMKIYSFVALNLYNLKTKAKA
jgi:hypothetical protein